MDKRWFVVLTPPLREFYDDKTKLHNDAIVDIVSSHHILSDEIPIMHERDVGDYDHDDSNAYIRIDDHGIWVEEPNTRS